MCSLRRAVLAVPLLAALLSPAALALDTGRSILVTADAEEGPPRVLLSWNNQANSTSHDVYRKSTATVSWGAAIATLGGAGVLGYTDSTVTPGVLYEYRVVRSGTAGSAYTDEAYVAAGVRVALNDRPGVLALVVDSSFSTSLSTAIAKLQSALAAEGWEVSRVDVSRTATPAVVKTELQSIYTAAGGRLRAAYLFGHVPVPYSGLSGNSFK